MAATKDDEAAEKAFQDYWNLTAKKLAAAPFTIEVFRALRHYPHLVDKVMPGLMYAFILGDHAGRGVLSGP